MHVKITRKKHASQSVKFHIGVEKLSYLHEINTVVYNFLPKMVNCLEGEVGVYQNLHVNDS